MSAVETTRLLLLALACLCASLSWAQTDTDLETDPDTTKAVSGPVLGQTDTKSLLEEVDQELSDTELSTIENEATLNEDPEAQRRAKIAEVPEFRNVWPSIEFYGSVRLHAINNFDIENELTEFRLGDGASRVGVRAEWQMSKKWWLFGRAEGGFDILETFTPKAGEDDGTLGLRGRLLYAGVDSDNLTATLGKSWSAYYKIAGMADRFSIFGGDAVGVYNAGTDGGATGTGRADEVLQARIYTGSLTALRVKPFNLNLQFQQNQPIPHVQGRRYGSAYGGSAWLETEGDRGMGIAFQRSKIDEADSLVRQAGIEGDAQAVALAFRSYGENWYGALVFSWLDNIEVTDELKYFNGSGAELYIQWQFRDRWWFISGGNWLKPDEDDPEAGEYEVLYGVLGLRYTFDSFNRMIYAEYRIDHGKLWDGTPRKNELTLGVRWDFGS